MTDQPEACGNCRFMIDRFATGAEVFCRRYPPVGNLVEWPRVRVDLPACGEYSALPPKSPRA